MQTNKLSTTRKDASRADRLSTEWVHCPVRGRKLAVTFSVADWPLMKRENVVDCPAMAEGPCDRRCLLPIGGMPFA